MTPSRTAAERPNVADPAEQGVTRSGSLASENRDPPQARSSADGISVMAGWLGSRGFPWDSYRAACPAGVRMHLFATPSIGVTFPAWDLRDYQAKYELRRSANKGAIARGIEYSLVLTPPASFRTLSVRIP